MILLAVTNRFLCSEPFLERVQKIAEEGKADYLILREKDLRHEQYCVLAEKCRDILQGSSVRLILHSDMEAAWELSVDAIHFPLPVFREGYVTLPEEKKKKFSMVGVSVHSAEEAVFAEQNGACYVTAGHVFPTDCKKRASGAWAWFFRTCLQKRFHSSLCYWRNYYGENSSGIKSRSFRRCGYVRFYERRKGRAGSIFLIKNL